MKVLITTVPFGQVDRTPLDLLEKNNIEYLINPYNRKLRDNELAGLVDDFDVIIAGTEQIDKTVINNGENLKFISRVGIGLDSVDLNYSKEKNIQVSYTPDAPAPAVAELTIGLMLSLIRSIQISNMRIKAGEWERFFGQRLSEMSIGIIGAGRIGAGVINHLKCFNPRKIFVNDIEEGKCNLDGGNIEYTTKEYIYQSSDLISLHVPLTSDTHNLITSEQLSLMKSSAFVINTARGGIVNERDLYKALDKKIIAGAAIDTYELEPYAGDLIKFDNCINTAHMGSMTVDCRTRMEIEATEEAIRFINGEKLQSPVPDTEYMVQSLFSK